METILAQPTGAQPDRPGISYDKREDISYFKGFDWLKASKEECIHFARATGFKETGMSVNEVGLMYDLLEEKKPKTIVELGRNYGTSTRLFLAYMMKHDLFYRKDGSNEINSNHAVLDSWDLKHWDGFIETMRDNGYVFCSLGRSCFVDGKFYTTVIRDDAHSIKTDIPPYLVQRGVDFLLIDTEHAIENALPEYCRWREYLNSGALIAFHDSTLPAVARSIEIILEMEGKDRPGRIDKIHKNECEDGFGICILEWKG